MDSTVRRRHPYHVRYQSRCHRHGFVDLHGRRERRGRRGDVRESDQRTNRRVSSDSVGRPDRGGRGVRSGLRLLRERRDRHANFQRGRRQKTNQSVGVHAVGGSFGDLRVRGVPVRPDDTLRDGVGGGGASDRKQNVSEQSRGVADRVVVRSGRRIRCDGDDEDERRNDRDGDGDANGGACDRSDDVRIGGLHSQFRGDGRCGSIGEGGDDGGEWGQGVSYGVVHVSADDYDGEFVLVLGRCGNGDGHVCDDVGERLRRNGHACDDWIQQQLVCVCVVGNGGWRDVSGDRIRCQTKRPYVSIGSPNRYVR